MRCSPFRLYIKVFFEWSELCLNDKQVESLWTVIKVQSKTGDVVGACSRPSHQQEKADEAILGEVEKAS